MDEEVIGIKEVKKVEDFIKSLERELSKEELISELKPILNESESKVKHILAYLERSGKILFTKAGVIWTCVDNYKLKEVVARGVFV